VVLLPTTTAGQRLSAVEQVRASITQTTRSAGHGVGHPTRTHQMLVGGNLCAAGVARPTRYNLPPATNLGKQLKDRASRRSQE
jgi:hypothetical protein